MTENPMIDTLFFERPGMDAKRVQKIVRDTLTGMDDGELFLEYSQSESLTFDDGRLRNASFNTEQGFGLRAVLGEATGYAHASELSEAAIRRAGDTVRAVNHGQNPSTSVNMGAFGTNRHLYEAINPLTEVDFEKKIEILQAIDSYLRAKDPRVKQVSVSLSGVWQAVNILRADGASAEDIRPLVRLNVSVVAEQNGRMESGSHGAGARTSYGEYLTEGELAGASR